MPRFEVVKNGKKIGLLSFNNQYFPDNCGYQVLSAVFCDLNERERTVAYKLMFQFVAGSYPFVERWVLSGKIPDATWKTAEVIKKMRLNGSKPVAGAHTDRKVPGYHTILGYCDRTKINKFKIPKGYELRRLP